MKIYVPLLFCMSCLSSLASTPRESFDAAINSFENDKGGSFTRLKEVWDQSPEELKKSVWPQMAMAYFNEADQNASQKNSAQAALYLREAANLNLTFGGRLEFATKSPSVFFSRLARLQTAIASETGSDPLRGLVNYTFVNDGTSYIVARRELEPEINGVTIANVPSSDALIQAQYFADENGKVIYQRTRWFVVPATNATSDLLAHITSEVVQDKFGRFELAPCKSPH